MKKHIITTYDFHSFRYNIFASGVNCMGGVGQMSVGFPRQEDWSGLPFLSPGDLPNPGIKPMSPALQAVSCIAGGFFYWLSHHGRLHVIIVLTGNISPMRWHLNKDLKEMRKWKILCYCNRKDFFWAYRGLLTKALIFVLKCLFI